MTVGVGHMIAAKTGMVDLTMYKTTNGVVGVEATLPEKQTEFDAMAKQRKGIRRSGTSNIQRW